MFNKKAPLTKKRDAVELTVERVYRRGFPSVEVQPASPSLVELGPAVEPTGSSTEAAVDEKTRFTSTALTKKHQLSPPFN